jgi:hypothetical protein
MDRHEASQMHDPGGFSLGNFLPRPFGVVSWCIIEMEGATSKPLPTLAVTGIPFDVRQNRYIKKLCTMPRPGGQSKKTVEPDVDQIMEIRHF